MYINTKAAAENTYDAIPKTRTALTEADIPLLDEIGETILPTTEIHQERQQLKLENIWY